MSAVSSIRYKLARTFLFQKLRRLYRGNRFDSYGERCTPNKVNVEYSHTMNLGDTLSPVMVEWMLQQRGIDPDMTVDGTRHLFAVGSVIGRGSFDATVWGSGILCEPLIPVIKSQQGVRKLDVRAVRGPVTRQILMDCGFECPEVYGDPAILLPLMFNPEVREKTHDVSLILHHATSLSPESAPAGCNVIDIATDDYRTFATQVAQSKMTISTSLHGIIISESYGVPSVYLWEDSAVGKQSLKFNDWYYSTGRFDVKPAPSLEAALDATPPALPDLAPLQQALLGSFPYDLWE